MYTTNRKYHHHVLYYLVRTKGIDANYIFDIGIDIVSLPIITPILLLFLLCSSIRTYPRSSWCRRTNPSSSRTCGWRISHSSRANSPRLSFLTSSLLPDSRKIVPEVLSFWLGSSLCTTSSWRVTFYKTVEAIRCIAGADL